MSFLLGLLLATCSVPGITSASIPTQWAFLSIVLPVALWRRGNFTLLHLLGLAFILWACLTAVWATNVSTSILGLWLVCLWALAFWYGATLLDLQMLWTGISLGLIISTGFAIAQAFGFAPVATSPHPGFHYAGLLYSHVVAGAAIALALVACIEYRIWLFMPPLALGLVLANSRGGFLVVALALLARIHWILALAALIAGALVADMMLIPSDAVRLQVWGYAIRGFSLLGWGPSAFHDVYYFWHDAHLNENFFLRAEYVHNDYLQLWFEYGIGALAIYILWATALAQTSLRDWHIFFAFSIIALFWFPLYHPLTAFIGCVSAGRLCRNFDPIRAYRYHWRPRLVSWAEYL